MTNEEVECIENTTKSSIQWMNEFYLKNGLKVKTLIFVWVRCLLVLGQLL